jgi:hypothetical protein
MLKKLYEAINAHGGWNNWAMNVIDKKVCSKVEARIHETKLMDEHKATLNKIRAFITKDQELELQKKWCIEHREQKLLKQKEWRDKHPDYMKNWRQKNMEHIKEHQKSYYQKKKAKKQQDDINLCIVAVHPLDSPLVQDALTHSCENHPPCELDQLPQQPFLELPLELDGQRPQPVSLPFPPCQELLCVLP